MKWGDKELKDMTLWELSDVQKALNNALANREEAAKHPKFEKMELPPVNPQFLELKNAVELEIGKKSKNA